MRPSTRDDIRGQFERFERMNAEVEEMARETGRRRAAGWALWGRALAIGRLGDHDQATAMLNEALSVVSELGDENEVGWIKMTIAAQEPLNLRTNLLEEATDHFRRAHGLRGLGTALYMMGVAEANSPTATGRPLSLFSEAVAIAEQLGDDNALMSELGALATSYFYHGDVEMARLTARRALVLGRRQGRSPLENCQCIFVLAACATADGEFVRGAEMLGYFDHLIEDIDVEFWLWSPGETEIRDVTVQRLAEGLGTDEIERQRETGRQLSFDQLTNLALGRALESA